MNKNLVWLAFPALLASCGVLGIGKSDSSPRERAELVSIVEHRVDLSESLDSLKSGSDWGIDRNTQIAKTVEWSDVSTPGNATYLARTVVLDQVQRHDADDFYGLRIRLGNRTTATVKVEYHFRFYDGNGRVLAGLHEGYRSAILSPRGTTMILDNARSRGAVGFRLFVRRKGSTDVGYADADLTWLNGPQDVTSWLNGVVFVDNLYQDNPAGTNRVMFRLGAKSVEPVNVGYRIIFFDERGRSIRSDHDEFRPLTLSADMEAAILNTCRRPGATGYRLFIRAAESQMDGLDDQSIPNQ